MQPAPKQTRHAAAVPSRQLLAHAAHACWITPLSVLLLLSFCATPATAQPLAGKGRQAEKPQSLFTKLLHPELLHPGAGHFGFRFGQERPEAPVAGAQAPVSKAPKERLKWRKWAGRGALCLGVAGCSLLLTTNPAAAAATIATIGTAVPEQALGWWIGGGVATTALTGAALYFNASHRQNAAWSGSLARQSLLGIAEQYETGRSNPDPEVLSMQLKSLDDLIEVSRGRITTNTSSNWLQRLNPMRAAKKGRAERDLTFAELVKTFAELKATNVSTDPKTRAGKKLFDTWGADVTQAEQAATRTSHDGRLALVLKDLAAEVGGEELAQKTWSAQVESFRKRTPNVMAKQMKEDLSRAEQELQTFGKELSSEQDLYSSANGRMRDRVSDRLASRNNEFSTNRERYRRLDALYRNNIQPILEKARQVDSDIQSAQTAHQEALNYSALAAATPMTRTETYVDSERRTQTREVSNQAQRFMYESMAASAALRASSFESSASSNYQDLRSQLTSLRSNKAMTAEALEDRVPGADARAVNGGSAVNALGTLFSPMFGMISNTASLFNDNSTFHDLKAKVEALGSEIDSRRSSVHGWVENKINLQLDTEMGEVANRAASSL